MTRNPKILSQSKASIVCSSCAAHARVLACLARPVDHVVSIPSRTSSQNDCAQRATKVPPQYHVIAGVSYISPHLTSTRCASAILSDTWLIACRAMIPAIGDGAQHGAGGIAIQLSTTSPWAQLRLAKQQHLPRTRWPQLRAVAVAFTSMLRPPCGPLLKATTLATISPLPQVCMRADVQLSAVALETSAVLAGFAETATDEESQFECDAPVWHLLDVVGFVVRKDNEPSKIRCGEKQQHIGCGWRCDATDVGILPMKEQTFCLRIDRLRPMSKSSDAHCCVRKALA